MRVFDKVFIQDKLIPLFILTAGTLCFPMLFFAPTAELKTELLLFTLSSVSSLSLAFIFFRPTTLLNILSKYKLFTISCFVILGLSIYHFLKYPTYTYDEFCFSILWVTIPFFFFINSKFTEKVLPLYTFILWIIDLLYSHNQFDQVVGIAGNRNWHAASLIFYFIFGTYFLYTCLPKIKLQYPKYSKLAATVLLPIWLFLTAYSSYIFKLCNSRASQISIVTVSLLFIYLLVRQKSKKIALILLCGFTFIVIVFTGIFLYYQTFLTPLSNSHSNPVAAFTNYINERIIWNMDTDVRLPLWKGCIDLAQKNLLTGAGTARFESEYESHRPISYFFKPDNAVRSNHPHNVILYILACYGIFGLIFWSFLWLYPLALCKINFNTLPTMGRLSLFVYICFFLHSLLDLIFFEWPTLFFACILLGILWSYTWKIDIDKTIGKPLKLPFIIIGLTIFSLSFNIVYKDFMSSYYFRRAAEISYYPSRNLKAEIYFYDKSLKYKKDAKCIYKAMMTSLIDLKNPQLALKYFEYFNQISLSEYAHKNGFASLAYLKLNQPDKALPYLIKEAVNYPALTASWYRLYMVQKDLGLIKASEASYKNVLNTLKLKKLPKSAIPLLLNNPEYDSHPNSIPEDVLSSLKPD